MQAVTEITFQWSSSDNVGWSWFRAYELCGPAPREALLSILVPDPNYVWWIDELMRSPLPTGGVIVHRLYEYGPFDTANEAEKMIEELKQQLRFRQSDLRVSPGREKPCSLIQSWFRTDRTAIWLDGDRALARFSFGSSRVVAYPFGGATHAKTSTGRTESPGP